MRFQVRCKNCQSTCWMKGYASGATGATLTGEITSEWEDRLTNLDCDHPDNMWDIIDEEEA